MKNRLYNYFYRKLHSAFLAKIIAILGYDILYIFFLIKKNFCKETINISINDSYKVISNYSKRPKNNYLTNEEIIDNNIDLSIIIPAYNVDSYIEKCLDSVVNQETTYNYEVIVINDGSTDDTLLKIEKYKCYKNFNIVSIKNSGVSAARNKGIDISKGMFLMFVDSDDILYKNAVQCLLKSAYENNAEIVQGSYYEFVNEKKKMYYYLKENIIDNIKNSNVLPIPGFPWGKVIKRDLFKSVRFPLNYWFEDTLLSYVIFRRCKKCVVIKDIVYGYRKNFNSITFNYKKSHKLVDSYYVVEEMIKECNRLKISNDEVLYKLTVNQLSSILYRRACTLNDNILKNLFNLCCNLLDEIKMDIHEDESYIYKELIKAFDTKNFYLWKLCSFII